MNPYRPLGALSDFVVTELPEASGSDCCRAVEAYQNDPVLSGESRTLAALDATMLEAKIVASGEAVPAGLTALVDQLTLPGVPGLTYEGLVLVNPLHDLRRFTCGTIGVTEALFYNQHRLIEIALSASLDLIENARESLESGASWTQAAPVLQEAKEQAFSTLITAMDRLATMPKDHFAVFRRYLGSHPTRGIKGPSGAFSATLPTLELEIRGQVQAELIAYLTDNWQYFPNRDQPQLAAALQRSATGRTLRHLAQQTGGAAATEMLQDMVNLLRQWRGHHYRAVRRQIPEAVSGSLTGTGGEANPGAFLRQRMSETV